MPHLVAVDLAGGPAFVDAVRRTWDAGDAILPIDRRLPAGARAALIAAARPHAVIDDAAEQPRVIDPTAPEVEPGDALVIASSGSTGTPKLAVHTRTGLTAHAGAVHRRLTVDPRSDRWLACLPLAHLGGLGVVLRSILTDTPVDVTDGFDAREVDAAPRELGSTLVSLVPTALHRVHTAAFRWVVLGGSADPGDRPPNVVRTYGLTETGGGVVYDGVPLEGTEVRLAADRSIWLRGPMLARGLRGTDGSTTPVAGDDGWLDTGDLGRWDPEGRLVVDGRADELIISGGENVWPAPVEAVLATHGAVRDVAVVGRADPEWGQRVVALVVPVDAADPPTLEDLRRHVREHLPTWCAPRELVVVEEVPRTALGKIRRDELDRGSGPQYGFEM